MKGPYETVPVRLLLITFAIIFSTEFLTLNIDIDG